MSLHALHVLILKFGEVESSENLNLVTTTIHTVFPNLVMSWKSRKQGIN